MSAAQRSPVEKAMSSSSVENAASEIPFKELLERYNARMRLAPGYKPNTEREVLDCLRDMFNKLDEQKGTRDNSFKQIPQFYFKKHIVGELKQRVRKEARTRFLERKAEQLLDEDNLETLWKLVVLHQVADQSVGEVRLGFDAFADVGRKMPAKAAKFFSASVFLKFPRDSQGRISARAFFHYLVRKVSLAQLRISLTCYDEVGAGYLREQDLENYIFEQIESLPQLETLLIDFYPYYVFTAVRKFVFFLDPLRKGKIAIKDIVASPILREFNELRQPHVDEEDVIQDNEWFSARAALRIYATYLNLDVDHNGMLSREEFSRFNGGSLTDVVVDRLFQEYRMYQSEMGRMEMDYKTFLDFVLAMQYRESAQSIRYFWKILDHKNKGYITIADMNFFFKAVVQKMVELGHDAVRVEDVTNEIFDMVRPAHPHQITLEDITNSGVGATVIGILTDVNGFWQYENREMLVMHDQDNQS